MKAPATLSKTTSHLDQSDEELMLAIQQRNEGALEALFHRYRALLHTVALRVVNCRAAAEEITQDCWLEVWRKADSFDCLKGKPSTWIVTLVRRRAIDYRRRQTAYHKAMDLIQAQWGVLEETNNNTRREFELADISALLHKLLLELPQAQRQAVCLAFMMGMSQREVAKATRSPLGTVKTRLELGLRKLRNASCLQVPRDTVLHA